MASVQVVIELVFLGALDCIYGFLALKDLWAKRNVRKEQSKPSRSRMCDAQTQSKTVFEVLKQCFVFGLVFLAAMIVFKCIFFNLYPMYLSSILTPEEVQTLLWFPWLIFFMFWTLPMLLVSKCLNFTWYQEIADLTCEDFGIKKRASHSLSYSWSDQITSMAVQLLFMAQSSVIFMIPIPAPIQWIWWLVHTALLYALYAFEYKWIQIGWSMLKRFSYVESKWPYFLGFGLPLTIITSCVGGNYIENLCIFSVLFPLILISSTCTANGRIKSFNLPLRTFRLVTLVADSIICSVCRLIKS